MATPGAEEGGTAESLKSKFFTAKRRLQQAALEKLGKAESAADDSEYAALKKDILDLESLTVNTHKQVANYLDSVRSMCFASAELGTCFNSFFLEGSGEGNADVAAASARFGSGMQALDEELRRVMDEQVVTQVLEPLEAKMSKFKELKKQMQTREQHRLDYDAYNRNVRSLKEKPSSNPRKLHEKEAKLAQAKAQLENSTNQCMFDGAELLEARKFMVIDPFRTFVEAQTKLFKDGAAQLSTVGTIPRVDPPAPKHRPSFSLPPVGGGGGGAGSAAPSFSGAVTSSAFPEEPGPSAGVVAPPPVPTKPAGGPTTTCRALYDYEATKDDELTLKEGDVVEVVSKQADGWWEGTTGGRRGVFPSNYVEEM